MMYLLDRFTLWRYKWGTYFDDKRRSLQRDPLPDRSGGGLEEVVLVNEQGGYIDTAKVPRFVERPRAVTRGDRCYLLDEPQKIEGEVKQVYKEIFMFTLPPDKVEVHKDSPTGAKVLKGV